MKEINTKIFHGRSVYSHRKCIKLDLDLEGYGSITTRDLKGFNEELVKLLPEVTEHECSVGEKNGFLRKLKEGTGLNHVCGHIAIAIQNIIGLDVSYCSEGKIGSENYYTVYEYKYRDTGLEAGNIAIDIVNSLIENKEYNLTYKLDRLKEILKSEDRKNSDSSDKIVYSGIPIVAVTGTNGKTTTTRLIAYVIAKSGSKVGMTTTDGIYINGQCVFEGDTTGPISARTVLSDNNIDVAVLETARGGLVRNGLAYDLADVAVITNVTDDHLGLDGVETMEDLAKVKALIGEAVKDDGYVVINGDDEMSLTILDRIKSRLIIFSEDKNNEAVIRTIKNGGYGIYIDKGVLCIEDKNTAVKLMPVKDIGITFNGVLRYNIQNAMAACGALIGFGIDTSIIKNGLEEFQCNEKMNPGRFNAFDVGGVLTILDYGHNIDGYSSVLQGLSAMEHKELIGIIGVPGDRLDRTTLEVGRIAGSYFDRIFIKEDKDRRGRLPGEIAELLKKGVLSSGFNDMNMKIILDEETALSSALDDSEPGDIVIVFFEEYAPLLRLIKERISNEEREVSVV